MYIVNNNVYYAAPGVERGFESVKTCKKLLIFGIKRCTQFTLMCNIPARREGQYLVGFGDVVLA